jgi:hypothetical protein
MRYHLKEERYIFPLIIILWLCNNYIIKIHTPSSLAFSISDHSHRIFRASSFPQYHSPLDISSLTMYYILPPFPNRKSAYIRRGTGLIWAFFQKHLLIFGLQHCRWFIRILDEFKGAIVLISVGLTIGL